MNFNCIDILNRHPDLSERFGKNIKTVRAYVTNYMINGYFDNISKSIENVSSSSIVNYDETNYTDEPKKQKIITKKVLNIQKMF